MGARRDVVISGLGVLAPIGLNVAELTSAIETARSGVGVVTAPELLKPFPAGLIEQSFDDAFPKIEQPYLDRCQHFAILAAREAIGDAGLDSFAEYGARAGLYYGNVNGGVTTQQESYQKFFLEGKQATKPFAAMAVMSNSGAAQISIRHKILGPVITHGSACSASGVAIGEAARAIRDGYLDVVIAGGAEATLSSGVFTIFEGARALAPVDKDDPSRSCKPFSKSRAGLVLGEGAAFFVLESAQHAAARGAKSYGYLTGYGVSADAFHICVPKMEGQIAAIQAALADAQVEASSIDYFNAHATATHGGDVIEANAIRAAFGAHPVPVSGTKSVHGHLLGAASVLELLITVVAMQRSLIPATANLDVIDPRCELNHVANSPLLNHPIRRAMSFSCGFGGTNVALVVSKAP